MEYVYVLKYRNRKFGIEYARNRKEAINRHSKRRMIPKSFIVSAKRQWGDLIENVSHSKFSKSRNITVYDRRTWIYLSKYQNTNIWLNGDHNEHQPKYRT